MDRTGNRPSGEEDEVEEKRDQGETDTYNEKTGKFKPGDVTIYVSKKRNNNGTTTFREV